MFSTYFKDKCIVGVLNPMLRNRAKISALVLWDKAADFVNWTCTPS